MITSDYEHFIDYHTKTTTPKLEAKMLCLKQYNVILVSQKDITSYLNYVNQTYGNDYISQYKNKGKHDKRV